MVAPLPEPSVDQAARIPHVAALDGLRGVAVAGVLLFHADHLQGGFLGVDLFFTLSGFLITSLLVVEHQRTGRISLRDFWARRARRLLPAMLAVVAAATAVAALTLPDADLDRFGTHALATLGYVANWSEIASARDYWALFGAASPLDHVWSLAIEEQFYLVWPVLVLVAVRLFGRRVGIRALIGVGLVASLGASWAVIDGAGGVTRAYYGTDTRAASILVGAALATFTAGVRRVPSRPEQAVGLAALLALPIIVASWFVVDGAEEWLYRLGFVAHAALTALVIAAVTGPLAGRLGLLLAHRALVRVGILSYGLYLWHWPVYVVLDAERTGLDGWTLTATRLAVSYAIATASFHLLEAPIRAQRWRLPRPGFVALGAIASTAALVVVVAWVPAGSGGVEPDPEIATVGDASAEGAPAVLVVGDSGPATIAQELVSAGAGRTLDVRVEAQVGCGLVGAGDGVHTGDGGFIPDPEGCSQWPQRWRALVEEHRPVAVVLMIAWGGGGDRDLGDGERRGPCDPAYDRYYDEQVRTAIDVLGSGGAEVLVATAPPHSFDRTNDERTACLNEVYEAAAADTAAGVLDLATWTCPKGPCADGADADRPDGIHFAGDAAAAAADWIVGETARLADLGGVPTVMLAGDSQAFELANYAPPADELGFDVRSIAALGCGVSADSVVMAGEEIGKENCAATLDALREEIDLAEPALVLLHAGAWEALDRVTAEGRVRFGQPAWDAALRTGVVATIDRLDEHPLAVVTTPCFADGPGRDAFGTDDLDARIAAYNQVLVEEAERAGADVIDLAGHLCPQDAARAVIGGTTVRPDGVHVDRAGARVVWPWIAERVREILEAPGSPTPVRRPADS